ncbi:MAG: lipopolysaccharide heptosyltransferase family protein [Betaproteobacteria bacterium]|nr:MAG: lipopolysaccharide heptosyltransferase family protein [Betaproteobacteria bacterium]
MKVLIVKRDKLGDLLLATPMLAHLKGSRPDAEVHLLANDYNAWVVEGNRHIDRLWIYSRVRHGGKVRIGAALQNLALHWKLRGEHFDWVIVANGEHSRRAVRRALAVRGARTVAYGAKNVSDPLPLAPAVHEMDRLLAMLGPLGLEKPAAAIWPRYVLSNESKAFADRWLKEGNLSQFVVLGLGARRQKKQPTTEQVLRWSAHFKQTWGLDTVFMWTPGRSDDPLYPGDDAVAQPVLDAHAPHIHPFRGPILEALGLIWRARASIFPDSGLMHFAAASPGGVLGLFAESDVSPGPANWAPRGPKALWLEAKKAVAELPDARVYERVERLASL